ncbi:MAG TPA: RDD family protein [Gaiellaceae bacterium]|nr:RDD family protein [Gaiellaceae bacterium]
MTPEEELEAQARLEADYMAGKLTADEYTERRRGLRAGVPLPEEPVAAAAYASWGRRATALLLDGVLVLIVWGAVLLPGVESGLGLIPFVLPALYSWLMVGTWGQTLGKMALGIRVLRANDVGPVTYARSAARVGSVWLLAILWLPLVLAYLWPLWDPRNQTLYDKMVGTIVVRVRNAN